MREGRSQEINTAEALGLLSADLEAKGYAVGKIVEGDTMVACMENCEKDAEWIVQGVSYCPEHGLAEMIALNEKALADPDPWKQKN